MKAQSELNWVFILVAGIIIFAFFVGFAFKYKTLQEEKTSIQLLNTLDNTLTSLKTSPYTTYDEINLPVNFKVTCDNIKIGDQSFKTKNLLFSQGDLNDKIIIYYKAFKAPFKITDFYFIANSNANINVFAQNQASRNYIEAIKNNLPENLNNRITLNNNPNSKIVGVSVQVNEQANTFAFNNKEYPLHEDLVLAAIFSDDFDCVYSNLRKEMNKAVEIYQNKALTLRGSGCNYAQFIPYLDKLKEQDLSFSSSITTLNNELARKGCPVLY